MPLITLKQLLLYIYTHIWLNYYWAIETLPFFLLIFRMWRGHFATSYPSKARHGSWNMDHTTCVWSRSHNLHWIDHFRIRKSFIYVTLWVYYRARVKVYLIVCATIMYHIWRLYLRISGNRWLQRQQIHFVVLASIWSSIFPNANAVLH